MSELNNFQKMVVHLDKVLEKFSGFVTVTCFIAMTCLVLTGVGSRFIFKIPMMWIEEAARYLMITGVYIGISMAVRERAHLGLTGLVDMLPIKIKITVKYIREIITIGSYIAFTGFAIAFMLNVQSMGQKSPALQYPMWVIYLPLIIGFGLSAVRAAMIFWNDYIFKNKALPDMYDEIQAA